MSLDNVIAVAAAARDSLFLLLFGLALSIPLMVWASQLILRLMDRFPSIIVLGGALLGWVGLSMAVHDPVVNDWVVAQAAWLNWWRRLRARVWWWRSASCCRRGR
jgi:predicted tellurium resistance membrane protein TerC